MNPNPPTDKEVSGPQCPQCGERGCDHELDDGDTRSWAERNEEAKGEQDYDCDKSSE